MPKTSLIAKTIYPEQTKRLGEIFAKMLRKLVVADKPSLVIAIEGTPISGKTTFIKGLAKGFGVAIEEISNVSFGFINEYPGDDTTFYLINPEKLEKIEVIASELKEIFKKQGCVIAVEGATKLKKFLPEDAIWLNIVDLKGTERALVLYPKHNTPIPEAFEMLRRLGA